MRLVPHRIPRTLLRATASVGLLAVGLATTAHAQPGVPAPNPPWGGPSRGAEFLLAHTGDLQPSDAQVVRLAAIARRVDARRRAQQARFDSARVAFGSGPRPALGDSARRQRAAGGPPPGVALLRDAEERREQDRVDLRDALGVLNADQQAAAWLLVGAPAPGRLGTLGSPGGGPGPAPRGPGALPTPGSRGGPPTAPPA